jgi:DnaJ-class molecular chaperone
MNLSEYEKSCKILNIVVENEDELTESILKKQYRKYCLLYHPDKKNTFTSCKFLEISKAYEYLGKYMGYTDDDDYHYDDYEEYYDKYNENNGGTMIGSIQKVSAYVMSNEHINSYVDCMNDDSNIKKIFNILRKIHT